MIVLNVMYTMKAGVPASDFVRDLEDNGLAPFCRNEKGNYSYHYYYPADGSNTLLLLEKWEDQACLDAHMKTENFVRIGQTKKKYVESTDIQKFII